MTTDIEIARRAKLKPVVEIAEKLDLSNNDLIPFGDDKAKLSMDCVEGLSNQHPGKLILVTAMSPTPAGEGKTTTSVGLTDGLNRIGKQALACLREPSLGPCFGMKGGAAGGGYAQVVPMEDINLHFTGDFHAIGSAHNLLSSMIDNHIYWSNDLGFDARRVNWRRVVDMNDRALRNITASLGGISNGFPRESGFDITVASEVMAIFCLAENLEDLQNRLGNIIVGYSRSRSPIFARDLSADGSMTVLLKDAFRPNLVQTLENNPALIHGGPFANIAHGCNSVIATKTGLGIADYVVTEAGFGADLGAEKFLNIKCRKSGLRPDAAVIVATIRALKYHGGLSKSELSMPNTDAVQRGLENLGKHIRNLEQFGVPVIVGVNGFESDTTEEFEVIKNFCTDLGVDAVSCTHWADGGAGAEELAQKVAEIADSDQAKFQTLYDDATPLWEKTRTVAQNIYGAEDIIADKKVRQQFSQLQEDGFGNLPVCMAKTQYSFSTDPALLGAPSGHMVPIREVRLAAGAGFVVAICGDIMTMPGLPRVPAANNIRIGSDGEIEGLF
ncbi:MAG: formate--tetrahydrofolate ligase [Acidiferrobacteraceae bacterium]|nr:formate--tetrahydrofolate ligase [Acidiferrobacteraceae bacterium]